MVITSCLLVGFVSLDLTKAPNAFFAPPPPSAPLRETLPPLESPTLFSGATTGLEQAATQVQSEAGSPFLVIPLDKAVPSGLESIASPAQLTDAESLRSDVLAASNNCCVSLAASPTPLNRVSASPTPAMAAGSATKPE
jgi:hypothetical protein